MFVGALVVPCVSAFSLVEATFPVTTLSLAGREEGSKLGFWGLSFRETERITVESFPFDTSLRLFFVLFAMLSIRVPFSWGKENYGELTFWMMVSLAVWFEIAGLPV